MGHAYRWLYYRCYRYSQKADSRFALHWANATVYVLAILSMNLIFLFLLLAFLYQATFGMPIGLPHWAIGAASVAIAFLHLAFVGHRNRYKRIIREFSHESAEQALRGDRLFGWYLVLSLGSVVAVGILWMVRLGLS